MNKEPSRRDLHRAAVAAKKPAAPGPKFKRERKAAAFKRIDPTWPATKDQKRQSRPVIYLHPIRALTAALIQTARAETGRAALSSADRALIRTYRHAPKHLVDAIVKCA